MSRVRECGLIFNLEKCQFSMSQLTFMDHVQSNRRVGVATDKVKALVEAREQESAFTYKECVNIDVVCESSPI